MVSGFDNVHVRANLSRLEKAIKFGNSAGDRSVALQYVSSYIHSLLLLRIYTSFAMIHSIITRLYVCDHRGSYLRVCWNALILCSQRSCQRRRRGTLNGICYGNLS